MGLIDSIHKAEEQGRSLARKGMQRARDAFADNETRLRRKMRVRPNPERAVQPSSTSLKPPAGSTRRSLDHGEHAA